MANKREFKKYVNAITESIVSDMLSTAACIEADDSAVQDAAIDVLKACETALVKASVKFDKTPAAFDDRHAYDKARAAFYKDLYRKVNKEFSGAVAAALKKFNAAIPAPVKEANKQAAKA